MKNTKYLTLLIVLITLFLCGCAHTVNISECIDSNSEPAGFWLGTWHGMIMFFSFIGSLFNDNITIYEINNNGIMYNFGYVGG